MMKREKLQANIKVRGKKKKKIKTFKSVVTKNFSTNILDVILSIKQDLMCIWVFQGEGDDRG